MKKLLMIFVTLLTTGCIQLVRPQVTSMPFDSTSMELTEAARGEVERLTVLGIFSINIEGEFSTEAAIEQALAKSGGDVLLNPTVDVEYRSFLGLMTSQIIRVSGQSAKFKNRPSRFRAISPRPNPDAQPFPTERAADGTLIVRPKP